RQARHLSSSRYSLSVEWLVVRLGILCIKPTHGERQLPDASPLPQNVTRRNETADERRWTQIRHGTTHDPFSSAFICVHLRFLPFLLLRVEVQGPAGHFGAEILDRGAV